MLQLGERQPVDRLERMVRDVAARCHITLRMGRWKKSSWSSGKDGGGVAARWKAAGGVGVEEGEEGILGWRSSWVEACLKYENMNCQVKSKWRK
jgi:hypothetical protein